MSFFTTSPEKKYLIHTDILQNAQAKHQQEAQKPLQC